MSDANLSFPPRCNRHIYYLETIKSRHRKSTVSFDRNFMQLIAFIGKSKNGSRPTLLKEIRNMLSVLQIIS